MSPRDWSDQGENIPHDLVASIGYLVFVFNDLEEVLTQGVCDLLNSHTEEIGQIVIRSYAYGQKVNLFKDLATYRLETLKPRSPLTSELPKLIEELERAGNERNAAVHAAWMGFDPKTSTAGTRIRIKQGKIERARTKFTDDSLTASIDWIEVLCERLYDFQEKLLEP